ncbi:MAG: thioredoxin domain-containing protein [Prolixibacteraceae bacterium]
MNKKLFIVILLLISASAVFSQTPVNVDALKFNELIQSGNGIVLDVRTAQEYSRGHIANSTLISTSDRDFVNKVSLLQKDKPIYVYCLTGSRSRAVAGYLSKTGFSNVYNLQQGILDWQRNNLPVVKSENSIAGNTKIYSSGDFQSLVSSNKLVFIDFNAVWCAPCKTMSPVIDQLTENYKQKVTVEKIDVEANRELAQALQVQSIPGFILYKNGQKIWSGKGIIAYDDLTKLLEKNL